MTPGMLAALMQRKNVQHKHDCYIAGITASMVANVHRREEDDKIFGPYDFVPQPIEDAERDELKNNILSLFGIVGYSKMAPEKIEKLRVSTVERLVKAGYEREDIEELFEETFASWGKDKSEDGVL
jgi:isopentenyl diphosphate isomerase/L-lactate dehydrogenase-like FMN-dependent dehydrogenase